MLQTNAYLYDRKLQSWNNYITGHRIKLWKFSLKARNLLNRCTNVSLWKHLIRLGRPGVVFTKPLKARVHWPCSLANHWRQRHTTVTIVPVLATLGDATLIGLFLSFVIPPKVAKASTSALLSRVIVISIIVPPLPM